MSQLTIGQDRRMIQRLEWLRSLPAEHREGQLVVLHARPGDLWRAPMSDDDDGAGAQHV